MNKKIIIISVVVVAVLLGGYFLSGYKLSPQKNAVAEDTSLANPNPQTQVMFSVDAKRWQFTPDVIRAKKGQKVKIIINNIDTTHGINLPDFNVAGNDSIEFTADKTGEFVFKCNAYCGDGHKAMQGKVIITE